MDAVKTKKRARPLPLFKNNPKVEIRRINGKDHFVCNHTLRLLEKRVFLPCKPSAASFSNLPCAVSWVMENAANEAVAKNIIDELCEHWEQPSGIPRAPSLDTLSNFGGDLPFATWLGDLCLWEDHTAERGQSVEEFNASKGKRIKKTPKPKVNKLKFTTGVHLVKYQGATQKNIRDGEGIDALKCFREVARYNKRIKEELPMVTQTCIFREKFVIIGNAFGHKDHRNVIASQIADAELHGPAMVIATKAFSYVLSQN